jgi:hypothetical protein
VGPVPLTSGEVRGLRERVPRALYTVAAREVGARLERPAPDRPVAMRQGLDVLDAILDARRALAA